MKKILFTLLAVIPVLGFAQQANSPAQTQVRTSQNVNQKPAVKATSVKAEVAPAAVVLTEEQQHAVWLKNNTQYQTMSKSELTSSVQQFEEKLALNAKSSEAMTADLKREIKWMKEILSAK